jgi:uncharacterized membrane protein
MTTGQLADSQPKARSGFRIKLEYFIWASLILGIFVTAYLTWTKFTEDPLAKQLFGIEPQSVVCVATGGFNCDAVTKSAYSRFPANTGIPIAYLGFGMYLVLAGLMLLEKRIAFLRANGKIIMFGIALFGWMFSMWLVYLQFFVLQALCMWCLTHETNMTVLFPLLTYRLVRSFQVEEEA